MLARTILILTLLAGPLAAQPRYGFTTWPYAPTVEAVDETVRFVQAEGDIVAEQLDDKVPWKAFLNGRTPPQEAIDDLNGRRAHLQGAAARLVSVTPLNTGRDGLSPGYERGAPWLYRLGDEDWAEAFARYCLWVIDALEPDYFIIGLEVNEFRGHQPGHWADYTAFSNHVRRVIRTKYPDLPLSESVTLHNLLDGDFDNPEQIQADMHRHLQHYDFTAISYYPFMTGVFDRDGFDQAFNWVRDWAPSPVAISETGFPAERLELPSWGVDLPLTSEDQARYMKALLAHAHADNYPFVIWWTHRDFDALWQTFPNSVKELGRIWRDTGLLDETGRERPALELWRKAR